MIKELTTILFLIFNSSLIAQPLFPIVEDSITFCNFCDNAFVNDIVWDFYSDVFTSVKTSNSVYNFYRLSDSTFHLRLFENNGTISKGKVLLKKENISYTDTVACFDCHPTQLWKELIYINSFVPIIKIEEWQIIEKNGRTSSGKYNDQGQKIKNWKYEENDTILITNHETAEYYYSNPNLKTITSNLNWISQSFETYCQCENLNSTDKIFNKLNNRFKIQFNLLTDQKNDNRIYFEFKENGELYLRKGYQKNKELFTKLQWFVDENGLLTIINKDAVPYKFKIMDLGEKSIVIRKNRKG